MTTTRQNPLKLGRKAKPTLKHKPVIWENMLGTVYAVNPAGEVKYFDYHWEEAIEYAQLGPASDLRTARNYTRSLWYAAAPVAGPRMHQLALWAKR